MYGNEIFLVANHMYMVWTSSWAVAQRQCCCLQSGSVLATIQA